MQDGQSLVLAVHRELLDLSTTEGSTSLDTEVMRSPTNV